jgi:hypothetical protein
MSRTSGNPAAVATAPLSVIIVKMSFHRKNAEEKNTADESLVADI